MSKVQWYMLNAALSILLLNSPIALCQSVVSPDERESEGNTSEPKSLALPTALTGDEMNWALNAALSVPFRGFDVQTGTRGAQTQDPLGKVSYSPVPSVEGAIALAYRKFGFTYRHTLSSMSVDSSVGASASQNEEFRFSYLINQNLFELTRQNLVGLQTEIATDNTGVGQQIYRPDIAFSDWRVRWIGGLPIFGQKPNSLANFYSEAEIEGGHELSVDLLYEVQMIKQKISAASPFVPQERRANFGSGTTLREVSSTGMGAGIGSGLTVLMQKKSYFSIAGLLGGNFNLSKASYSNREDDISGLGLFLSARMSVQYVFGKQGAQNFGFRLLVDNWTIPAKEEKVSSSDAAMSINYSVKF